MRDTSHSLGYPGASSLVHFCPLLYPETGTIRNPKKNYTGGSRQVALTVNVAICNPNTRLKPHPRLALSVILRLRPGSLVVFAPVCSTMGTLARNHTRRCFTLPIGNTLRADVENANVMSLRFGSFETRYFDPLQSPQETFAPWNPHTS